MVLDPSTVTVGDLVGSGTVTIDGGSTFDVVGGISAGESIVFAADAGVLQLGDASDTDGIIAGFVSGDTIDLTGVAHNPTDQANLLSGDTLQVITAGGTFDFALSGDFAGEFFHLNDDGAGGTSITDDGTPCYCRGTLILTDHGEVAVEDLRIGDHLMTLSGAARPIRWIGHRGYAGRFAAANPDVLPVLIHAGALDENVPWRDLYVSPLHAMFLDDVLIPAIALVNDRTIVQVEEVDQVEYFHLELDSHDVILADGAPAESFVDDGSRGMFHNAAEYRALYPDALGAPARFCAPRVEDGEELEAVRRRLSARADAAGYYTPRSHTIAVTSTGTQHTVISAGVSELHLVSPTGFADGDARRLGALIADLSIDDAVIEMTDRRLRRGFHKMEVHGERTVRWTNGHAVIAVEPAQAELRLEFTVMAMIAAAAVAPEDLNADGRKDLEGAPKVPECSTRFDMDLERRITAIVDGLPLGAELDRVLAFLTAQVDRLLRRRAEAEGQRQGGLWRSAR